VADTVGESRPGWRVLRVLGNRLDLEDCEYQSAEDVRAHIARQLASIPGNNRYAGSVELHLDPIDLDPDEIDVPIYSVDSLVRRSEPLQATRQARERADDATDEERRRA